MSLTTSVSTRSSLSIEASQEASSSFPPCRSLTPRQHHPRPPPSCLLKQTFFASCPLPHIDTYHSGHQKKEVLQLVREALLFFVQTPSFPPVKVAQLEEETTPLQVFDRLFECSNIVCAGERHANASSKAWLIQHLLDLKISTLFIEHLHHDTMETPLAAVPPGDLRALPEWIIRFIARLDEEYQLPPLASFTSLIQAALAHNIEVIPIDTSLAALAGARDHLPQDMEDRIPTANFVFQKIINEYCRNHREKRCLVLLGADHGSSTNRYPCSGVAEMVGAPFVLLKEGSAPDVENYPSQARLSSLGYCNKAEYVHSLVTIP